MSPLGFSAPVATTVSLTSFPNRGAPAGASGSKLALPSIDVNSFAIGGQLPGMQHLQHSFLPTTSSHSTAQPFSPQVFGPSSNQKGHLVYQVHKPLKLYQNLPWRSLLEILHKPLQEKLNQVGDKNCLRIYFRQLIHLLHPVDWGSICDIILQWNLQHDYANY